MEGEGERKGEGEEKEKREGEEKEGYSAPVCDP